MLTWIKNFVARWTGQSFNPLFSAPVQGPWISPEGVAWIANFEAGGRAYYDRRLRMPTWPGGASGVTIGIGYDVGYNTVEQLLADWATLIPATTLARLQKVCGIKGTAAKSRVAALADIRIPWEAALKVFQTRSVPRFGKEMVKAFPGAELLPIAAQEALLSLVFNRGASLSGESRREMAEIRKLVGYYRGSSDRPRLLGLIADEVVKMKRLWVGKGLDGLLTRRDQEAARIRNGFRIDESLVAAGGLIPMLA
jgi:GH24 family phage-related lysozyme (muramidase)